MLSFEALLFTIAIAFILLAMAKERTELRHKTAALVDPLTGIANRRAFLEEAAALAKRQGAEPRPAAVLLADLDHFKSINDRFGHAVGDRVLQVFAETASAKLGPCDLIGRLGGEEFAIVLYDAGREKGLAIAERIRLSFDDAAADVDGRPVGGTVSIGMVVSDDGPARHPGAAGAGRRGALLRQGARPQPHRGRLARARHASARKRGSPRAARASAAASTRGLTAPASRPASPRTRLRRVALSERRRHLL